MGSCGSSLASSNKVCGGVGSLCDDNLDCVAGASCQNATCGKPTANHAPKIVDNWGLYHLIIVIGIIAQNWLCATGWSLSVDFGTPGAGHF